jgi:hypothetical protein
MNDIDKKEDILYVEETALAGPDRSKNEYLTSAMAAEADDLNMGVWLAVKTNKWAVFWSLMVSMTVVRRRVVILRYRIS